MGHVPACGVVPKRPPTDFRHGRLFHVDPAGQQDEAFERLAGHGVPDVLALHFADSVDREGAVVSLELEVDLRGFRGESFRDRAWEDREDASALLPADDLLDRHALVRLRFRVEIEPAHAVPHVDRPGPPEAPRERRAVQLRRPERPFLDVPRYERFAAARRRKRVEIAWASPRTVATLDILRLKIPFRWHRLDPLAQIRQRVADT